MDKGLEAYQRFLNGEESALDELINMYRSPLEAFISGFVSDAEASEELMMDTFAELIFCKNFKGASSLKTYLFAIGRNKALRYSKHKETNFVPLEDVENYITDEELLDDKLILRERHDLLHEAIKELSPQYKEVLYLIYFEEMSYREVAQVLKKSEKQISNLVFRAKKSLKQKLEGRLPLYE